jgi:hypothetical protein
VRAEEGAGAGGRHAGDRGPGLLQIRLCVERLEDRERVREIPRRPRPGAGGPGELAQFEVTQSRLVLFAEQVEVNFSGAERRTRVAFGNRIDASLPLNSVPARRVRTKSGSARRCAPQG